MNIDYSNDILNIFSSPMHIYSIGDESHLVGYAGDPNIGEYVHLYFQFQKSDSKNYADNKIIKAKFSAIGGVVLIAACEKFCALVENITFHEALKYCDPEVGLQHILNAPQEKTHSINFVIQAFYKAFEVLTIL